LLSYGVKAIQNLRAVKTSVLRHLWYLTEELVISALFDTELSDGEREAIAKKLSISAWPTNFEIGKPIFPVGKMTLEPQLDTFVGKRKQSLMQMGIG